MIELKNIEFSYTEKGVPALVDISACMEPGIYLLAGENGAGKTTLLHIIAGVSRPSAGECLIDGVRSCSGRPSEMGRTFLHEENMYFPGRSIREFASRHSRFYPGFSEEQFMQNLSAFGLSGDEPLKSLSLGNRKKSQLAYVLALGVDVLLLDEPTNALDIESKETLRRLTVSSLRADQTVIVATHTVTEFENLFDGALMMHRSRLLYAGTSDMVTDRLEFRISRVPEDDALYTEIQPGRVLNILPAAGSFETRVDWRLLYSALHSAKSKQIINQLTVK